MKNLYESFVLAAVVLVFQSCTTLNGGTKPGSALAARLDQNAHASKLDKPSRNKAVLAEVRALTNSPAGTITQWQGKKSGGKISIGQSFEVSGRPCRRFQHEITVEDVMETLVTTACLDGEGFWEPLS